MSSKKASPPIFLILPDHVAAVRRVADAQGLTYGVADAEGLAGVTEFRFQSMDDGALFALMEDIPDEAYASRAIVGDPWTT
ncbi:hypothetical protein BH09PSE1_BH09PSE1_08460 [soil metagenome]